LNRIKHASSLSVSGALSQFGHSPSPPNSQYIHLSDIPATLFTSPDNIDSSFDIWLQIPIPNVLHRSDIRQALAKALEELPDPEISLEVTYASHQVYLPIWILDLWPGLGTLVSHCHEWASARSNLFHIASTSLETDSLVQELRYQRGSAVSRHRILPLDIMISEGTVRELLIPVHRPSHWALLYTDLVTREYVYIDSLNPNTNYVPPSVINPVITWLSEILNRDIMLHPGTRPFPLGEQSDSHSCGVAVLSSIAHYVLGGEFVPWSQHCAKAHRLRWVLTLLDLTRNQTTGSDAHTPFDVDPSDFEDEDFTTEVVFDDAYMLHTPSCTPPVLDLTFNSPKSIVDSLSDSEHSSLVAASTPCHPSAPKRPLVQSKLPFKPISRSEWRVQESRHYHERQEENQREADQLKLAKEKKKMRNREHDRARKRVQRAHQKALRSALLAKGKSKHVDASEGDSQGNRSPSKRSGYQGTTGGTDGTSVHRVNWTNQLIWPQIERTAVAVGYPWSPVEIVRRLRLLDPNTFATLRPQRISQWRDHHFPTVLRWTESHMRSIKAGDYPTRANTGRTGVLQNYPDVVRNIKNRLLDLRKAGVALDIDTIRGYMSGVIHHAIPTAFTQSDKSGRVFRCSREFVRSFLRRNLAWSLRKATCAAQKHPSNVDTVLLHAFLRFARIVRDEEVPAVCIVNADQTQVVYNAGSHSTWNTLGERQVHVLGVQEKRAFTLLVAASNSGDLLPFQAIYGGKTARSLPDANARGFSEARRLGFLLDYSGSDTYWSTQSTMQRFVSLILAPYFRAQIKQHNLPSSQRCIFQIDCWSVHRSAEFRGWMATDYPWIIILYVPGGCTGLFQACDVGLQRVLKLAIRQAAHNDVVDETLADLESGTPPEAVVNDQRLHTLRNRSIDWILRGFHSINRPDIVQKAFRLCSVPGTLFNLSYESLASRDARQAILTLATTDPATYAEIMAGAYLSSVQESAEEISATDGDIGDVVEPVEVEADLNHTVEEVAVFVLAANTAIEAAEPLDNTSELGSELESDDESAYMQPLAATVSTTRSGRATRLSSRYCGQDWLTH
ncbi:hypothetical protein FRC06_003501, partial [Ceratobasidium sp. 370]